MVKKLFFLWSVFTFLISSCGGEVESNKDNQQEATQRSGDTITVLDKKSRLSNAKKQEILAYVEVKTWIDDFRNFRMAIYNNDVPKLKTYFSFPFDDKGHTIIGLCEITQADWVIRKKQFNNTDLFYEADLEKYYKKVFDERFTKAILKTKSEQLFLNHSSETKWFVDDDFIYKLYADYSEEEKTLMLNISIGNNAKYDDGNYVSEGEHNIIYHFKIIDDKKMILIKMDYAG